MRPRGVRGSARRGKTARARGNAFEREVAAKLGGRRVGQYGDKVDVDVPGYMRVQCKVGAATPSGSTPGCAPSRWRPASCAPSSWATRRGSGKRRTLIVMDLDEYRDWHGK